MNMARAAELSPQPFFHGVTDVTDKEIMDERIRLSGPRPSHAGS